MAHTTQFIKCVYVFRERGNAAGESHQSNHDKLIISAWKDAMPLDGNEVDKGGNKTIMVIQ